MLYLPVKIKKGALPSVPTMHCAAWIRGKTANPNHSFSDRLGVNISRLPRRTTEHVSRGLYLLSVKVNSIVTDLRLFNNEFAVTYIFLIWTNLLCFRLVHFRLPRQQWRLTSGYSRDCLKHAGSGFLDVKSLRFSQFGRLFDLFLLSKPLENYLILIICALLS